jgi:pimeloyl-ACP methyl ester carboxylesterase
MPVLVVHGEEDRLVPVDNGRELARLIPHADLRIVPNAGHLLGTDAEQETADAVLGHIAANA